MKITRNDGFFIVPASINIAHHDLGPEGKWFFMTPDYPTYSGLSIWQCAGPFENAIFLNHSTSIIIKHIEQDLGYWLNPSAMEPAEISECFLQPISRHFTFGNHKGSCNPIHIDALKMVLDYVHVIGQHHSEASRRTATSHILWVPDTSPVPEYPVPDFRSLLSSVSGVSAVVLSMRHPGPYDGGVEYMAERLMKPLVDLLYNSFPVAFLPGTDCVIPSQILPKGTLPLLVACGSSCFTAASRVEMAATVRPTLIELIRDHDPAIPLPKHSFVYGLHWSKLYLHIFMHFPVYISGGDADSGHWEFCQTAVAQHRITLIQFPLKDEARCWHNQGNMVLDRWRLIVALVSIQRHMTLLRRIVYPSDASSSRRVACSSFVNGETDHRDSVIACLSPSCCIDDAVPSSSHRLSLPDFLRMRTYWRGPQFSVPAEWIPINGTIIDTETGIMADESKEQKQNLSFLYLDHLRTHLVPIPKKIIMDNQLLETYYGPNFLHLFHSPRAYILSSWCTKRNRESNTLPHLYRIADFLAMAAASWHDVNIHIATLLAGFHGYTVRWNPTTIRYPFPIDTLRIQSCIVDFALAIQVILPTTRVTIHRTRDLPLSISSPAVLLGVRSLHMDSVGSSVTSHEINDITQLMKPHLQLMRLYSTYYEKSHPSAQFAPTLLCLFLKAGYLHILSFASGTCESSAPTGQLIDSLPFALQCQSDDGLLDRMRIAMALFTLQRHIAKICSEWDESCWPRDMLADEHECIVDVTGVSTPSPTAYVDHNDKSWWYDQAWLSEGETDDAKSQEGSSDAQAHDVGENDTHIDKKWKGPDYDEDLKKPIKKNRKGAPRRSRAEEIQWRRARSRRLVCRWVRGLPQEQELSYEEL